MIDPHKYYKAVIYTQKMDTQSYMELLELVDMYVRMNGVTQPQALILLLEEQGVKLDA